VKHGRSAAITSFNTNGLEQDTERDGKDSSVDLSTAIAKKDLRSMMLQASPNI